MKYLGPRRRRRSSASAPGRWCALARTRIRSRGEVAVFRGDLGYPKTGLIACGECSRQRAMVRMERDERRTEGVGTLDRCGPCRIIELEMEMRTVGGLRVEPSCRRAGRRAPRRPTMAPIFRGHPPPGNIVNIWQALRPSTRRGSFRLGGHMPPPLVSESPLIVAGFAVSVLGFVLIVSLIGSLVSAVVPHPSLPLIPSELRSG